MPSKLLFPYRCTILAKDLEPAIEFLLTKVGRGYSEGALVLNIAQRVEVKNPEDPPRWWYQVTKSRSRTKFRFFFLEKNDLMRFALSYGNSQGYEIVRRTEDTDIAG